MALIECPECSRQVSSEAEACPNCAYPIANKKQKKNEIDNAQLALDVAAGPFGCLGCLPSIALIGGGLTVLLT